MNSANDLFIFYLESLNVFVEYAREIFKGLLVLVDVSSCLIKYNHAGFVVLKDLYTIGSHVATSLHFAKRRPYPRLKKSNLH